MNKQQGQLFIWIGATLILGLVSLSIFSPPLNDEEKKWVKLTSITEPEVENIIFNNSDSKNTISVSDQHFEWLETDAPINGQMVASLLKDLLSAKCGAQLTGDLEEYGLLPPQWQIIIEAGAINATIQVGNKAALSNHHYVICDGMDGPRLSQYAFDLPDKFEDLIDTQLFKFNPNFIDSINLNNGQKMELIDGTWVFTHPQSVVADNDKVIEWLASLSKLSGIQWMKSLSFNHTGQISLHSSEFDYVYDIGESFVTTNSGNQFTVDESTIEHMSLSPDTFYSTSLSFNGLTPVKIDLKVENMSAMSEMNESAWSDAGDLWKGLTSLEVSRVAQVKSDLVGSLSIDFNDGLQKVWSISMTDTHYQLDYSEETVLILVEKQDLNNLLLTVEK